MIIGYAQNDQDDLNTGDLVKAPSWPGEPLKIGKVVEVYSGAPNTDNIGHRLYAVDWFTITHSRGHMRKGLIKLDAQVSMEDLLAPAVAPEFNPEERTAVSGSVSPQVVEKD